MNSSTSSPKTEPSAEDASAERPAVSAIHQVCGGLIETSWLAAAAVIPLFYNAYGYRGFEPEKLLLLRVFAIVVLCAWMLRATESAHGLAAAALRVRSLIRNPFVLTLSALSLAYLLATCFSVNPGVSLWGSNDFRQGTLTFLAGLAILASVAVHLRTDEQSERLVSMILATTLPVALYAIIQRAGFDPIGLDIDRTRVVSTLGHPIFLAGYLLMAFPLIIWRLLRVAGSLRENLGNRGLRIAVIVFYCGLAIVDLIGFLCAQSRGPLLGLGAAMAFLAVGLSARSGRWLLLRSGIILGAFALAGLVLLCLPNGPLGNWASLPGLQHFALTIPLGARPDWFRDDIWREAPKLMLSRSPLPFAAGGEDRFHWLRPLIGYGPETLANVLPHFFTLRVINGVRIESRFHNLIWDTWFGIGGLGLAAFLAFVILLFAQGYRRLGWMETRGSLALFLALITAGVLGGAGALWLWQGAGFAGLGLLVGLVAGLAIHPLLERLRRGADSHLGDLPEGRATLLIVLLSAIAGHLVDMGFSFPTAATLLLFSVYSGLIISIVRGGQPDPVAAEDIEKNTPWECAIFAAIILCAVIFTFVRTLALRSMGPVAVIKASLVQFGTAHAPSHFLYFLVIPTWLGVNFAFASDAALRRKGVNFGRLIAASALLSGLMAGAYLLLKAGQVGKIGSLPQAEWMQSTPFSQCVGLESICVAFVVIEVGLAAFGAAVLARRPATEKPRGAGGRWIAAAAVLAAIAAINAAAIRPLRADVAAGMAETLLDRGSRRQSAAVFHRPLVLSPRDPVYLRLLARARANSTGDLPDVGDANSMSEAEARLIEARNITSGMDPGTYELGRLYLSWAGWETRPEEKVALARQALAVFDQALIYDPLSPFTWNDSANADLIYLDRPDDAQRKLRRVVELVKGLQREWGDYCSACGENAHDPNLRQQYEARAMEAYQSGIDDPNLAGWEIALCRLGAGNLLLARGEIDLALASLLEAIKLPLGENAWKAESGLAVIYSQKGDLPAARRYIMSALADAPGDRKAGLIPLRDQIEQQ